MMRRSVCRPLAVACFIFALSVAASGQEAGAERRDADGRDARRTARASVGLNVDENFELNIGERRITERNFFASTAIETAADAAHGLNLRVGVAVGASEIDVLLRNVRGRVRFRASLDALQRVLDARRPAASPATPPPQQQQSVP